MMNGDLIAMLDAALVGAGSTAAFTEKELASQPCRDPGAGGCMPQCETCAARARLHRVYRSNAP